MRMVESVFRRLFSAFGSISLSVCLSSRFLTLSSMKSLTSSLHSAGFCFILSLSSRGMRIVIVVDMNAVPVTHIVVQSYKRSCLTLCLHGGTVSRCQV